MSLQLTDLEILDQLANPSNLKDWQCFIPIQKSFLEEALNSKEDSKKPWKIGGYASTEDEDLEQESIIPGGLDTAYLMKFGWINWNHDKNPGARIGIPTYSRTDRKGFYLEAELIKEMPMAREAFQLMKAVATGKYPRNLGYSVEGKVISQDGKKITKAFLTAVALTPNPVNTKTYANLLKSFQDCSFFTLPSGKIACSCKNKTGEAVTKGMEAGYQNPVETSGNALRVQSLEKDLKVLTFGPTVPREELIKYVIQKAECSEEMAKKIVEYASLRKSEALRMLLNKAVNKLYS